MARLCGGAHEISGIHAPLFFHGWVVLGSRGWGGRWGGMMCVVGVGWSMSDRWWVGVVLSGLTWSGD